MKSNEAPSAFRTHLESLNLSIAELSLQDGIAAMISFYQNQRFEDCRIEEDGDMLLFQWGEGYTEDTRFSIDLTRQLMYGDGADDEIWQLSLTFYYTETENILGNGNRWCSNLEALPDFIAFIAESPALQSVKNKFSQSTELQYDCAG